MDAAGAGCGEMETRPGLDAGRAAKPITGKQTRGWIDNLKDEGMTVPVRFADVKRRAEGLVGQEAPVPVVRRTYQIEVSAKLVRRRLRRFLWWSNRLDGVPRLRFSFVAHRIHVQEH